LRCLGFLAGGAVTGAVGFVLVVVVAVTGGLLGITVAGAVAVPVVLAPVRALAGLERRRVGLLRGRPARPYRPIAVPTAGGWGGAGIADGRPRGRAVLMARLRDPATWRDIAWLLLALPVGLVGFLLAAVSWLAGAGLATVPVWYRFLPGGRAALYDSGSGRHGVVDSVSSALPWAAAGLVLLVAAYPLTVLLARGQAALAARLLGPGSGARLRARVVTLTATRAAALDGRQRELRRIERDLHDGAQARLVALGAELGLAHEAFDRDPVLARRLVSSARDEAMNALGELRDLVRGIGPPILADRGLAAAVEAVAAGVPVPVSTSITLPDRLPPVVETAAYFVICECLANAAKHSGAGTVEVAVRVRDGRCLVRVRDDGHGGADPAGEGLAGLAGRVGALDGEFTVDSPAGGPTEVRAELPCVW
jgi:signal transduction histidine kinase